MLKFLKIGKKEPQIVFDVKNMQIDADCFFIESPRILSNQQIEKIKEEWDIFTKDSKLEGKKLLILNGEMRLFDVKNNENNGDYLSDSRSARTLKKEMDEKTFRYINGITREFRRKTEISVKGVYAPFIDVTEISDEITGHALVNVSFECDL